MERKLILNSIKTPDGTILISRHRHDFVSHTDKVTGKEIFLDGGNDYQRIGGEGWTDLSIYSDAPFEVIRENYCRGGRGKDGKQPLTWVALSKMNTSWVLNCISYNEKRGMGSSFANEMYKQELAYRNITKSKDKTGEKHITNEGYEVEIIEYFSIRNCTIKFIDGSILYNIFYQNLKNGQVKNFNHKTVYKIGYFGYGIHKSRDNRKQSKKYTTWRSMIERGYNISYKEKYPTYKDCTVDERWHNFQNFAEWFEENYVEDFELDKDILVKGNKTYSSETCCFVPKEINYLLLNCTSKRGEYPIGVTFNKSKKKFVVNINNKNHKYLGTFSTSEEAFQVYKQTKESYIKEVAKKWKDKISDRVYQALINYKVEITD